MSKYTTEVRFICENYSGLDESVGYDNVDTVIANSREKIFSFNYPIYDESYRPVLETKILKHFYTREIGAETVGLWKLWLDTRLNEIMPYYNQRYKSTLLDFNPLLDVDITTEHDIQNASNKNDNESTTNNRNNVGNNKSDSEASTITNSNESNDSWKYYSDTPQGGINGLSNLNYLTNATHDTANQNGNTGTETSGSTSGSYADSVSELGTKTNSEVYTSTEAYIERITGKRSGISYSKMLEEFRESFLNIDMEIIHELDDLFINLW